MNTKIVLTTLLAIAVFAVPAAVPASQPSNVRLDDLKPVITLAPATTQFAALLGDPSDAVVDLAIILPVGFTTLEWINQDPFAL